MSEKQKKPRTKQMTSLYVAEIDKAINGSKSLEPYEALKEVATYIRQKIDPTFPEQDFIAWADSDSEKPFRHNRKRYFWSK